MSISSTIFMFAFLPFALIGYYLIKTEYRNIFLLIMSLLFYAWGEPKFVFILCVSIFANYIFALLIEKFRQNSMILKIIVIFMIIGNISLLFIFKYLVVTIEGINSIFKLAVQVPNFALPLGISFFTFRAISYVLDVYFETSKAQKNILNVGLYISFFPQLTMGPISKYCEFESQIHNRICSAEKFSSGVKMIIVGLAKKVILSNAMGIIADKAFSLHGADLSVSLSWLGIIAYLFQLYYDFSGYSDIAIGLSKMFGFDCVENFDYPYISKSIGEFWRRWHISLGNWLKDYLYTPTFRALMNKKNPFTKTNITIQQCDIIALLVTWIVCGMWHGAGKKFLVYGMYYYIFIVGERLLQARKKKIAKQKKLPKHKETKLEAFRAHIYTLIVIIFGQLIFRASTLSDAIEFASSMFGLQNNPLTDGLTVMYLQDNALMLILVILFSFPIKKIICKICNTYVVPNKISRCLVPVMYIALFIVSLSYMISSTSSSFIYFKF